MHGTAQPPGDYFQKQNTLQHFWALPSQFLKSVCVSKNYRPEKSSLKGVAKSEKNKKIKSRYKLIPDIELTIPEQNVQTST